MSYSNRKGENVRMNLAVLAAVGDITVNLWIQYPALFSKETVALQER